MAGHFTNPKFWKTHRFSKIRLVPGIHHFEIIRAYFKTSDQLSTLFVSLLDPSWNRDGPLGTSRTLVDRCRLTGGARYRAVQAQMRWSASRYEGALKCKEREGSLRLRNNGSGIQVSRGSSVPG